ncbi:MAG: carbohydrate kinase [Verrucomicrobiales bacterium]|nr:carbohydrate kinase [Verrucomicrobiales bacterium]
MPEDAVPSFDIVGIGMSILDSIKIVPSFPAEGGVTEVHRSALMGGGPVPTALCAASRLGAKTAILDRIGDDWRGDLIHEDYTKFGVDVSFLKREAEARSTFGTVLVRELDGERHIIFEEGDFTPFSSEELPFEALGNSSILHLNGRHWPACIDAARMVKENGGLVSFDGGAHRYDSKFHDLFPYVDILIVARDFAECLSESQERRPQLDSLSQWGADIVGITNGVHGSDWLINRQETFHQPAFPVEDVVDTTGCGDVFHGAFLFALSRGDDAKACARFASATAALSAKGLGGRGNLPSLPEVEGMLAETQG